MSIDLVFPSPETRQRTEQLLVTAVEPFAPSMDGFTARQVIKCGDIGTFPPVALFNREGAELLGVESVLVNRESNNFPLDRTWSVNIPAFTPSAASNPWQAVLVHVEARGTAQEFRATLEDPAPATLLAGCFCVRLDENATGDDPMIDAAVRQACVGRSEVGGPFEVTLEAVAPPAFRLRPCGVDELSAPRGQRLSTGPTLCVDTIRCDENAGGEACYTCRTPSCSGLDDLRNVPLEVTVEGGDSSPIGDLILTDVEGMAVPQVDVGACDVPFKIGAQIFGRPESLVSFDVECVPSIAFEAGRTTELSTLRTDATIAGVTTLPGTRGVAGSVGPTQLVVLTDVTEGGVRSTVVSVFGHGGDRFETEPRAKIELIGERARGVHGYYYRTAPVPDLPLLAVATSTISNAVESMTVRLYQLDGSNLTEVRMFRGDCPNCACNRPGAAQTCERCTAEESEVPCEFSVEPESRANFVTSDIDADGFADLSFGLTTDFPLVTFYSRQHERSGSDPFPPPLESSCTCSTYGKKLPSFELPRLGGLDPSSELLNVDLVVADATGALGLYASGNQVDGPPCDPDGNDADQCGALRTCRELCPGAGGRCVQDCTGGGACDASGLRPTCTTTLAGAPTMMCGGAQLGCGQPLSIWPLFGNVRHVRRGVFTDSGFEDIVAIGSRSQAPGADDRGLLRLIFGARLDLTRIGFEEESVRAQSAYDLVPVPFEGKNLPQGPRTVQIADFNGDGRDDISVLYGASEEVHVWLGGGNKGPGEIARGVLLSDCNPSCDGFARCLPFDDYAASDFDGDGRAEIAVVCMNPQLQQPRVQWHRPALQ